MDELQAAVRAVEAEVIQFTQELVRTKSYSGEEKEVIALIKAKMEALDYDQVTIDTMGNLVGRVGEGPRTVLFDSHVDTVRVDDETAWDYPPFGGQIVDGRLYGRGSVDMKSAAAASVFAGALAKKCELLEGKTIYVSCTVLEEDCDGENLKHMLKELALRPDYVVICEPSGNKLATGHRGKAQLKIKTKGFSAHGSAPEKGLNAIYEMAEIISRIEALSDELLTDRKANGTLVASQITSQSASLNAVPFECEVYLDRRLALGETWATVEAEMAGLIAGKKASWEIGALDRQSWTGLDVLYEPIHMPWRIESDQPLYQACVRAHQAMFGAEPELDYWDFSTNAVTTTAMGLPTIGFGPGEYKLAHMVNENCAVEQIIDACKFYAAVMATF